MKTDLCLSQLPIASVCHRFPKHSFDGGLLNEQGLGHKAVLSLEKDFYWGPRHHGQKENPAPGAGEGRMGLKY